MSADFLADIFGGDDADWMQHPARPCAQGDPDRYFPRGSDARITRSYARRMCHGCPVINRCLDYALRYPELDGIWGGLKNADRKELRNKKSADAA